MAEFRVEIRPLPRILIYSHTRRFRRASLNGEHFLSDGTFSMVIHDEETSCFSPQLLSLNPEEYSLRRVDKTGDLLLHAPRRKNISLDLRFIREVNESLSGSARVDEDGIVIPGFLDDLDITIQEYKRNIELLRIRSGGRYPYDFPPFLVPVEYKGSVLRFMTFKGIEFTNSRLDISTWRTGGVLLGIKNQPIPRIDLLEVDDLPDPSPETGDSDLQDKAA